MSLKIPNEILRQIAKKACTCYVRTAGGGFTNLPMYEEVDGIFQTLSGLRATLESAFTQSGYTVDTRRLVDMNYQKYACLDNLAQGDLSGRDDQIDVLGLVIDHPESFVVEAPTAWGKSFLIAQVCLMFPTLRIAVVAPGKDIVSMLHSNLKLRIRDIGKVGAGSNYVERITVCTMTSLYKLKGFEWDLLLFDEVQVAYELQVQQV